MLRQRYEYARAKNPYLFHSSQPTLQATFSQPQSLYGANSQGERNSNPGVVQAVARAKGVDGAHADGIDDEVADAVRQHQLVERGVGEPRRDVVHLAGGIR